jgi:hypothetical protein
VKDSWEFIPAETCFVCISTSAITKTQTEIFATMDPSHLFLIEGNHTRISNHMTLRKDGGDPSSTRLTTRLLKGSLDSGLLLMAQLGRKIARESWMRNASFAHGGLPNLYFLA